MIAGTRPPISNLNLSMYRFYTLSIQKIQKSSLRNLDTCEIGSNHLQMFLEICALEKYMKSLKFNYERINFNSLVACSKPAT